MVHITNDGNSPEVYSIDPRLNKTGVLSLHSFNPLSGVLPVPVGSRLPDFIVPPFSTRVDIAASSTVPITMSVGPGFGSPEVLAGSSGDNALATLVAPDVATSVWLCPPAEIGPFPTVAVATTYSCSGDATTNLFDPAVTSATGNIWSVFENLTSFYNPLILQPGQSGTVAVTITPSGRPGTVVSGFLAVETYNPFDTLAATVSSDQVTALPYTYTVG